MENQDLLYHYFSNSLTTEQEKIFENLLENDTEFKTQFLFEQNVKEAIKSNQTDTLKAKLKGYEKELETKDTKRIAFFDSESTETSKVIKPKFNAKTFAIAASIALLMGWFGYQSFFGTDYASIYEANYSTYPNTVYTITRGDTENTLEREAFVAYESKDFETAIEKLDAIAMEAKKDYFNFYKAQAYLHLKDFEQAKTFFRVSIQDNKSFVEESTWYLALIALKKENKLEAKSYLEELVANYSYNKDVAKALLEKLD